MQECPDSCERDSQQSVASAVFAGKPRGYAFIEYEHKNNMKEAYKRADGKKVEGRRVVVDVERGRTVPNWSDLLSIIFVSLCPLTSNLHAETEPLIARTIELLLAIDSTQAHACTSYLLLSSSFWWMPSNRYPCMYLYLLTLFMA